jgi:hypothetical protein
MFALALSVGQGLAQELSPARIRQLREDLARFNPEAARRAVDDLSRTEKAEYDGARHRAAIEALACQRSEVAAALAGTDAVRQRKAEALIDAARAALLANPVLASDRIVALRRTLDPVLHGPVWTARSVFSI